jgi:acyl-coenzyme A synthetase/AMP-(fatty) acid ligase
MLGKTSAIYEVFGSELEIVKMIDHLAKLHPCEIAIESASETVRYCDLVCASRDLAERIVKTIEPNGFVGIEANRDPVAIIAILAALRAQRPFVVIDPRDGDELNQRKISELRLNHFIRADSPVSAVALSPTPKAWNNGKVFSPREELTTLQGQIAYAIHTSGSTGKPKCVLVGYEGLSAVIKDHVRRLDIGLRSRTLQFAKLTFDGCLTEIFWTLCAGGCLVLVDEVELMPGEQLQETLEHHHITHLKTTPFALTATQPSNRMRLQHVINGGGACRQSSVKKWGSIATFHNAYGCTETTICNLLSDGLVEESCNDGIPLGRTVGNCQIQIDCDDASSLASRGELVVTGDSVGIGYLCEDGVEAFQNANGKSIYFSGDLVEKRSNEIYFVERIDRQVKVRGYRIDPGEIEDLICQIEGIDEAVIDSDRHVSEDGDDAADTLLCYFQGEAQTRTLREFLNSQLPHYKVPSVFKRLTSLPYTKNGKVDRNALQDLRVVKEPDTNDLSPREEILDLVRHLTGTEDAAEEDNFFDIGGDSASAIILLKKLKELGWTTAGVRDVIRAEQLRDLISGVEESEETARCVV